MRLVITAALMAALSIPAFAQQPRPQPPQQQQRPAPQPQQQPAPQAAQEPPGMFACRTEQETCFVAIVLGASQVSVLYTNDPRAEGVEQKPVNVQGGSGPVDLSQHMGRVVMLTAEYNAQSGLTKAEVIDVASPLLSFAIKSMLSGGGEEEEEPEPEPKPKPRQQPQRR